MTQTQALAQTLALIGQGQLQYATYASSAIVAMLVHNQRDELAALYEAALLRGATAVFDKIVAGATFDPVQFAGQGPSNVCMFAAATRFNRPRGAQLQVVSNPEEVARAFAASMGVDAKRLQVLPMHLPTLDVLQLAPGEAYHLCASQKALWDIDAQYGNLNAWRADDAVAVFDETVFMVLLAEGTAQEAAALKLRPVVFPAEYEMAGAPGAPLRLQHDAQLVGPPWWVFQHGRHLKYAYNLAAQMSPLSQQLGCGIQELRAHVVVVSNRASGVTSTRTAIYHPERAEMSGLVELRLDDAAQYVRVANALLGGPQVSLAPQSFSTDDATDACDAFLLPGQGWVQSASLNPLG
jgi:hypothetical protein